MLPYNKSQKPWEPFVNRTAVDTSISVESRSTVMVGASNCLGHTARLVFFVREINITTTVRIHIPAIVTIFISNGCDKEKAKGINAFHTYRNMWSISINAIIYFRFIVLLPALRLISLLMFQANSTTPRMRVSTMRTTAKMRMSKRVSQARWRLSRNMQQQLQ